MTIEKITAKATEYRNRVKQEFEENSEEGPTFFELKRAYEAGAHMVLDEINSEKEYGIDQAMITTMTTTLVFNAEFYGLKSAEWTAVRDAYKMLFKNESLYTSFMMAKVFPQLKAKGIL